MTAYRDQRGTIQHQSTTSDPLAAWAQAAVPKGQTVESYDFHPSSVFMQRGPNGQSLSFWQEVQEMTRSGQHMQVEEMQSASEAAGYTPPTLEVLRRMKALLGKEIQDTMAAEAESQGTPFVVVSEPECPVVMGPKFDSYSIEGTLKALGGQAKWAGNTAARKELDTFLQQWINYSETARQMQTVLVSEAGKDTDSARYHINRIADEIGEGEVRSQLLGLVVVIDAIQTRFIKAVGLAEAARLMVPRLLTAGIKVGTNSIGVTAQAGRLGQGMSSLVPPAAAAKIANMEALASTMTPVLSRKEKTKVAVKGKHVSPSATKPTAGGAQQGHPSPSGIRSPGTKVRPKPGSGEPASSGKSKTGGAGSPLRPAAGKPAKAASSAASGAKPGAASASATTGSPSKRKDKSEHGGGRAGSKRDKRPGNKGNGGRK
jgi:hypothetical protein